MTRFAEAGLVPIPGPSTAAAGSWWFRIAEDSRCFEGHFDGAPILPGVAHVALGLAAYSRQTGIDRVLSGIRDVRFSRPLGPGVEVEVILTEATERSCTRFEIRCGGERASAGLLIFELDDASCH